MYWIDILLFKQITEYTFIIEIQLSQGAALCSRLVNI